MVEKLDLSRGGSQFGLPEQRFRRDLREARQVSLEFFGDLHIGRASDSRG
jgi:hypothetical protein